MNSASVIVKRLLIAIPTLMLLHLVTFGMVKAIPGDPAVVMLGDKASASALAEVRARMGLDQPWYVQYGSYFKKLVVEGDLGHSLVTNEPNRDILVQKFPATMELTLVAMLFAALIGIPLGVLAALYSGRGIDLAATASALGGVSMPVFWLGLMLVWVFGLQLGWLPLSGRMAVEFTYEPATGFVFFDSIVSGNWALLRDAFAHVILPAATLGTIPMAFLARMARSSMLEVLGQDYVRTARAKGLSAARVTIKHAFRNAFLPVLTLLGMQFGLLLGGAMITETIFAWPGMGTWILGSVAARDYPALEIGVLTTATVFVVVNVGVDILYRVVDPRIGVS